MKKRIHPDILDKYLNNRCTEEEKQLVEQWYLSLGHGNPNYLDSLDHSEQIRLQNDTFTQIYDELKIPERRFYQNSMFRWFSGIAASLLLISGLYLLTRQPADEKPIIARQSANLDFALQSFVNHEPRIVTHKLPDGTVVSLRTDAEISYPQEFEKTKRVVYFKGEGFFDVAHDKTRPFIVQSGGMNIKVLGTKFNVKASARQRILEVAVLSGSVAVSADDEKAIAQQVVLKPRQQVFFETITKRLTVSSIPTHTKKEIYEPITATFNDIELNEVIKQLDKRFDIQIHLVDAGMATCRLTADFEQQSLPTILDMLCTTLEATYSMSGKVVLIQGEPCN